MEQNLESKVSALEKESRDLRENIQKETSEKYAMQSELSEIKDMNRKLLKIIENLSCGIGSR